MNINVVSPWYPDRYSLYSGTFVEKQVGAVAALGHSVTVEAPEIFPAPAGSIPNFVWNSMRELADDDPSALFRREGISVKVPSPVPTGSGSMGRAESFAKALAMKRDVMPIDFDVCHAHLGVPTARAASMIGDRPLVVTEHQSTIERVLAEPGAISAYRELVTESARFVTVSSSLKRRIISRIGQDLEPHIHVVPNIVDVSGIVWTDRREPRTSHWIYVGTIAEHKGVELLARAFDSYRKRDAQAHLTLIGGGPHLSWLKRFVAGRQLSGAVSIVGAVPQNEVGRYLAGADVMVHLSRSETFGIATLEAIAAGLPVVSLENGGAEDSWGDFVDLVGRLLPSTSEPEEVADAVHGLQDSWTHLDLREGRSQVEERYSAKAVADRLDLIYREVA